MSARPHRTETVENVEALVNVEATPIASDEPPAPARLTVQRGLFFGPSALVPEDLYSVVTRGGARRERHRVVLDPHSTVGTNTYWGRFHATYWQRWTAVGEVEVTARVSGTGRVRLMASDANKVWRIVAAEDVHDADGLGVRLVGQLDRFVDGGGLWLELTTESAPMTVEDVRWSVAADDDRVEVLGDQRGGAEEQPALHDQPGRGRVLVGDGRSGPRGSNGLGGKRSCCHAVRPSSGRGGRPAILGHTGVPDPVAPTRSRSREVPVGGRGRCARSPAGRWG